MGAALTWVPSEPYSVGIEEEVMLLDPGDWGPAARADEVLPKLPRDLSHHLGSETHRAAVELATEPHATVGAAIAQLAGLRERLAAALDDHGLRLAAAGVHPFAVGGDTEVSEHGRYQLIADTMRGLARREPTFALHVHVGVADPRPRSACSTPCAPTCRCAAAPSPRRRSCGGMCARSRASAPSRCG